MGSRDQEERRRMFWHDLGCIVQLIIGVAAIALIVVIAIPVALNGGTQQSIECVPNSPYEVRVFQNGFQWKKYVVQVSSLNAADYTLLATAHDSQVSALDDITALLWCTPDGVVVKGVLKGSNSSALFVIDRMKRVRLYGSLYP